LPDGEGSPVQASLIGSLAVLVVETVAAALPTRQVTAKIPEPAIGETLSRAFASAARSVAPAVVRIEVSGPREDTTASGIVLDTRGNVVTNSHAFDGWDAPVRTDGTPVRADAPRGADAEAGRPEGETIEVILRDGRSLAAELVGLDAATEVAVIRMRQPPGDLSAARFGDSDDAAVGEWVLALGSPFGLDGTVTAGIISAEAQQREPGSTIQRRYLVTDANINPGEAGGPLADLDGRVIGVTASISAGPGGGYTYASPINDVRRVAAALIKDGHTVHPFIGVGVRDLRDLEGGERRALGALPASGSLVSRVGRDTPAARAGLRPGDVITSVDSREVPTAVDLVRTIAGEEVGARIMIGFVRRGALRSVPLFVGDLPALPIARTAVTPAAIGSR
jgi:S1-C subfamily serine protease